MTLRACLAMSIPDLILNEKESDNKMSSCFTGKLVHHRLCHPFREHIKSVLPSAGVLRSGVISFQYVWSHGFPCCLDICLIFPVDIRLCTCQDDMYPEFRKNLNWLICSEAEAMLLVSQMAIVAHYSHSFSSYGTWYVPCCFIKWGRWHQLTDEVCMVTSKWLCGMSSWWARTMVKPWSAVTPLSFICNL